MREGTNELTNERTNTMTKHITTPLLQSGKKEIKIIAFFLIHVFERGGFLLSKM